MSSFELSSDDAPTNSGQEELPGTAGEMNSEEEQELTILEQMGGLSGLVSSTLPVLVFVPAYKAFGIAGALAASLLVAVGIFIWRILQKQPVQPAVSGLLSVAICSAFVLVTKNVNAYFLYGIWVSLIMGIAFSISVLVKWPLVGVIWNGINSDGMQWQKNKKARRYYSYATCGWIVVSFLRFFIQNSFFELGNTTNLWLARMLMGWPLTGVVVALTVWMVRLANKELAHHESEESIAA